MQAGLNIVQVTMGDVGGLFPVWLTIADYRCSPIPVLGMPILRPHPNLHRGGAPGDFVVSSSQFTPLMSWRIESPDACFRACSLHRTIITLLWTAMHVCTEV